MHDSQIRLEATDVRGRGFARRSQILERLALDAHVDRMARGLFPVRWPNYYLDLVAGDPSEDPIARLGRPSREELTTNSGDIADPIADRASRPVPFMVRKHRDRVILLVTRQCHFYCRFCFRREERVHGSGIPDEADWQRILAYLKDNPEIQEPILSGGDPLTLDDAGLFHIRDRLLAIPSVLRWRIHTRAPVHFPERITRPLLAGLAAKRPPCIVTHFNHAREITAETGRIAALCSELGIPLKNQAVLLNGINDSVAQQRALWRELASLGIAPHHLHHPDRVAGNAAFRVTLQRGLALYRDLVAGGAIDVPDYVLDLPDGRGKVAVDALCEIAPGQYRFTHPDGSFSHYRDFDEAAGSDVP